MASAVLHKICNTPILCAEFSLRFKNTKTRFHGFSHEHHLVGPEEVSIFEEVRNSVPAIKRQLQTTDSCALLAMRLKWTMPIYD